MITITLKNNQKLHVDVEVRLEKKDEAIQDISDFCKQHDISLSNIDQMPWCDLVINGILKGQTTNNHEIDLLDMLNVCGFDLSRYSQVGIRYGRFHTTPAPSRAPEDIISNSSNFEFR